MNFAAFVFYTTIGSAIWNCLLIGAGYYLSYLLPEDEIAPTIKRYGMQINIAFFALLALVVIFYALRRKKRLKTRR